MKIAEMMKGIYESTEHIFICDKNELQVIMVVFTSYCNENKQKQKAKNMLKQFENELEIYRP